MLGQVGVPLFRGPEQGFEQGEFRLAATADQALDPGFLPFIVGGGISGDTPANAVFGQGAMTVDEQGPDGDIELGAAVGKNEPESAGIDAPGSGFQFADDGWSGFWVRR